MIHICSFCQEDIKDGEIVTFVGHTKYKRLESKIAFALDPNSMIVDPDTLSHYECKGRTVGF